MVFHILTLFPELIKAAALTSITGRAVRQELVGLDIIDIRDFSINRYGSVDDYPYGGGAGMLMMCEPVFNAVAMAKKRVTGNKETRVLYPTPQGRIFDQSMAHELSGEEELIIVCGHYEGVDERVIEEVVTDPVSIGDYVLTGGELPAAVIMDAVSRLIPGVLHNGSSADTESFENGLLEYPQYTRPEIWHGKEVPPVLLSGDHGKVERWRFHESLKRTGERRPELLRKWLKERGIW
ncbi:MAG: tRNA (guanosine(37)-N1)-methyltransferase TrmD [Lachnospiraceae bacterium]|nr:tRNA (guanosine(37)-N1)-methyltransferase TrmD [Lachnospiraceae bacterium]